MKIRQVMIIGGAMALLLLLVAVAAIQAARNEPELAEQVGRAVTAQPRQPLATVIVPTPILQLPPMDQDNPQATATPPNPAQAATPAASYGFDAARAKAHVDQLAGVIGRRASGSTGLRAAADYIAGQFKAAGYSAIRQPLDGGQQADANIIAIRPALSGDTTNPPILIIGGHYDSVSAGPGAVDNASGTAIMLELARSLGRRWPTAEVRFIAFAGEETGLRGSSFYVGRLSTGERTRVRAMFSIDSAAAGRQAVVVGSTQLALAAQLDGLQLGLDIQDFSRFNLGSDHAPFVNAGMPGVTLGRWLDAAYHQAGDLPARVSLPGLTFMAGWAIAVGDRLFSN